MSQYASFPIAGVPTYPSASSFPARAYAGALAVAVDTDSLYMFDLGSLTWILVGTAGSTVTSVGPFGSSPNADGGSISANTLTLQPADGTHPGGVSTAAQTIAGSKTFTNNIIGDVVYQNPGTGSVARTIKSWMSDQYMSVKDFGAVGDGTTDDTAAIKATLAALFTSGGGVCYFPKGRYKITSSIDMGNYCTITLNTTTGTLALLMVHLLGEGADQTTLIWSGGSGGDGKFGTCIIGRSMQTTNGGAPTASNYMGHIDNLTITTNVSKGSHAGGWNPAGDGNPNAFPSVLSSNAGVNLGNAGFMATYPVLIDQSASSSSLASCAIYLTGESPARISGCHISGFAFGIWCGVGYESTIQNNYLQYNLVGIALRDAITATLVSNNILTNNAFGIFAYTTSQIEVSRNAFEQNTAGCDIQFGSWNILWTVKGNYFEAGNQNLVFRGFNAGQFRTQRVYVEGNNGVNINCDLRFTGELYIRDNQMDTGLTTTWQNVNNVVDRTMVYVQDNYYPSPAATPYGSTPSGYTVLFTAWNLSQVYLRDENTFVINDYDARTDPSNFATGRTSEMLGFVNTTSASFPMEIGIHNVSGACVAKVTLLRASTNPKNVTYAEYAVGITRKAGAAAIADVRPLNVNTMATQGSGDDSSGGLTAQISGAVGDDNFIQLTVSASAGTVNNMMKVELYDVSALAWLVNIGPDTVE